MFVLTAKVSKTKIALIVTAVIAVVVIAVILHAAKKGQNNEKQPAADTNEGRILFLTGFGWEINTEPVQMQNVTVPKEDSEVFTRYNELQKSQGYDLTKYRGKQVTRYVYEILNYPNAKGPVYATLFVYQGKVIGGDVTNSEENGRMHGFKPMK
jgi:hypothetical protein